jgi:hypothetical protein
MSGPYPPSGYPPQPEQGGWPHTPGQGGQYGAQPPYDQSQPQGRPYQGQPHQGQPQPGQPQPGQPQPGQPHQGQPPRNQPYTEFPTVQYGGLSNPQGGWGEPPRKKRSVGRIVVAVVSVLIIIGGVATAAVLLTDRHEHQEAQSDGGANNPAPSVGATSQAQSGAQGDGASGPTTTEQADPGVPNGSTTLSLTKGACVSARAGSDNQYDITRKATCGTATSDLVLADLSPAMTGCADHQYLRVSAPTSGVYCFTLDLKQGDCLDSSYIKVACGSSPFVVLKTEAGPGGSNSCTSAAGATHWVPVGLNPVQVGCIGPPPKS